MDPETVLLIASSMPPSLLRKSLGGRRALRQSPWGFRRGLKDHDIAGALLTAAVTA